MGGIFGAFRRDGAPLQSSVLDAMRQALPDWGPDGFGAWHDDVAGLAQARLLTTPGSAQEPLPVEDRAAGFAFTAAARIDNRDELIRALGLELSASGRDRLADGDLMLAAYRRWGVGAPRRVLGDWSFAAWHPSARRLFIARDHFGNSALYYHLDANLFAFACAPQPLRVLGLAPPRIDELRLAQYLISWPAPDGATTFDAGIRRLPPAHMMTVTPERLDVQQYWDMGEVTELRLPRSEDYVEGLREHFDEAVRTRLRSRGQIAVSLSGGLDSGSVAATAAEQLRSSEAQIPALTSVPVADPAPFLRGRVGDELPLARAVASAAGDLDLVALDARDVTPIQSIHWALEAFGQPSHVAGNNFWIMDLLRGARDRGCRVLLTGQMGNAGVSWRGSPLSQPVSYGLRELGAWRLAKAQLARVLPHELLVARARQALDPLWYRSTAIHPELVRRLELAERRLRDPDLYPRSPRQERLELFMPGRTEVGAIWAALGTSWSVEVRDPTADVRLISFALSVPDRLFIDPRTRTRRWLIREAMRGRLPDEVRLTSRRGLQAADLVPRLRASSGEVDGALDEVSRGPAAAYVDVPHMRQVWAMIKRDDTPEALRKATTVLTRGIMAGLYVNSIERAASRGSVLASPV